MVKNRADLAKYRLKRAEEDLKGAEVLLDNNLYKQSINRSYYAIFHATRALLALDKFDYKKHSGVIAYFNKNYVANGKIEKEYSKILMRAHKLRNKGDYTDFFIASREDAKKLLIDAKTFFEKIEAYIQTVISE